MKTIKNLFQVTAVACLISGQVMAQLSDSDKSQFKLPSNSKKMVTELFQKQNFEVPQQLKQGTPQSSLNQIYEKSKSGVFQNRAKLGGMDGGGGKVLLCPTTQGAKAKVLDIYEGEAAGLQMDLGNGKTLDEKIKFVLNRLAPVAPYRATVYAQWIQDLLQGEGAFFSDAIMPVTDDVGVTVLPLNCQLVQVVVQRNNEDADIPGLARYLFDRDVFMQLDLDSKVALLLHEVIYREARARGEKNSLRARYLNYLVLSKNMNSMTTEKFNQILKKMGSRCSEFVGVAGRTECEGLSETFAQQEISWNGLHFKGESSIYSLDREMLEIRTHESYVNMKDVLNGVKTWANVFSKFEILNSNRETLKIVIGSLNNPTFFDLYLEKYAQIHLQNAKARISGICKTPVIGVSRVLCLPGAIAQKNGESERTYDHGIWVYIYDDGRVEIVDAR